MKKLLNNKGVSLIEIVAALVLLSIVAVPLGKTFIDSFKFQARGQIKTEANKVNEYVAEQLKKGNYFDVETTVKNWHESANTEPITFIVDKLPSTNITSPYDVKLEKISVENISEAGDGDNKVTAGGISVPKQYDDVLTINSEGASFLNELLGFRYEEQVLIIDPVAEGSEYDILIVNSSQKDVIIEVEKHIENAIRIYTTYTKNPEKPEEEYSVTLRQCTDPGLSRAQKTFTQINLGDKNSISNETEYLYEATITSVNKEDETIKASMSVTFTVAIPNEE